MKFPFFKQLDGMGCGPSCLRMIAKYYGKIFSFQTLAENCHITHGGVSMLGISDAAESIGFRTSTVRLDMNQLKEEVPLPCIVHWEQKHFIVVYNISSKSIFRLNGIKNKNLISVADPAIGLINYTETEFTKGWISIKKDGKELGYCLILEPTPKMNKTADENLSFNTLRFLLGYIRPYKNLVFQLFFSFIVASILQLFIPFLTQSIIDKGVNYKDVSFLTLILFAQSALIFGKTSVEFIRGWIMLHLTTRVNISLISDFLSRLMRLPIAFFDSKMTGDLMQRIGDNSRIQNFLTNTSLGVLFSMINFIIFGFVLIYYNVKLFLLFILGSALYVLWVTLFMKYRRELDNYRFAQASNNQSNVIQLITGMQEVKLNNCEKKKRWEWEGIQAKLFKISVKGLMISQNQNAGAVFINSIKNFIITYYTARSVIEGQMTLGMMLSVQYIIGQLNSPIEQFIGFMQGWQDAKISLERLGEIQRKETEDVNDQMKLTEIPADRDIILKNVSFQYAGPHSPFVLKDINLLIPTAKITAIVGPSGSGKTTLLKLILGFYSPVAGEIWIGNTKLNMINNHTWRMNTGAVLQDGFIFSDTIMNNIALNDEVPNKSKIYYSTKVANIRDFIESMPLGYNTKIGSEGIGISQGQKQRILIARAVYKDPLYIFFDESTNALDAENERVILKNLNEFFKGRTVITIAHRLSTVKNADKIIVLEKGKIAEEGSHYDLTGLKGSYYNLVKNQLELGN